jgi:hypothetical protein
MKDCVAQVAAIATRTSPLEFAKFCRTFAFSPKSDPPYEDIHFYAYLLHHGYFCGYRVLPDADAFVDISIIEAGGFEFSFSLKTANFPAYVRVATADPLWDHAVYWDGFKVIDPSHDAHHRPDKYKIKYWTPIARLK